MMRNVAQVNTADDTQRIVADSVLSDADYELGRRLAVASYEVQHAMLQHVRAVILPDLAKRAALARIGNYAEWLNVTLDGLDADEQLRTLGRLGSRVAERLQDVTLIITSAREQE